MSKFNNHQLAPEIPFMYVLLLNLPYRTHFNLVYISFLERDRRITMITSNFSRTIRVEEWQKLKSK